jgi:hypothetical protein
MDKGSLKLKLQCHLHQHSKNEILAINLTKCVKALDEENCKALMK